MTSQQYSWAELEMGGEKIAPDDIQWKSYSTFRRAPARVESTVEIECTAAFQNTMSRFFRDVYSMSRASRREIARKFRGKTRKRLLDAWDWAHAPVMDNGTFRWRVRQIGWSDGAVQLEGRMCR